MRQDEARITKSSMLHQRFHPLHPQTLQKGTFLIVSCEGDTHAASIELVTRDSSLEEETCLSSDIVGQCEQEAAAGIFTCC